MVYEIQLIQYLFSLHQFSDTFSLQESSASFSTTIFHSLRLFKSVLKSISSKRSIYPSSKFKGSKYLLIFPQHQNTLKLFNFRSFAVQISLFFFIFMYGISQNKCNAATLKSEMHAFQFFCKKQKNDQPVFKKQTSHPN